LYFTPCPTPPCLSLSTTCVVQKWQNYCPLSDFYSLFLNYRPTPQYLTQPQTQKSLCATPRLPLVHRSRTPCLLQFPARLVSSLLSDRSVSQKKSTPVTRSPFFTSKRTCLYLHCAPQSARILVVTLSFLDLPFLSQF
jgi:hypothetical protein